MNNKYRKLKVVPRYYDCDFEEYLETDMTDIELEEENNDTL